MAVMAVERPVLCVTTEPPTCECPHAGPDEIVLCGELATIRATVHRRGRGCAGVIEHFLLCEPCAISWQEKARGDGAGDRVVFTRFG